MYEQQENIRHLRAFLAVAELNSVSQATEAVYLSQPAITQAINKLETSIALPLFQRKSTGMYLTEGGEIFATRVRRALSILEDGLREALKIGSNENKPATQNILSLVTTTQLNALKSVAAAQNYSAAGRQTGISQSSLHRSTKELEGLLNIVLFEKTSLGLSPSKATLALTKAIKLAFSEISQGKEEINALRKIDIGRINIGSMPLARTSILPNTIIQFLNRYPNFKISVLDGPYLDLLNHLRQADIDILIGALRFPVPSDDVIQHELLSSGVVIIGRPNHPLINCEQINPELLAKASWVIPRQGAPTRTIFDNFFIDKKIEIPHRLVESNSHMLIRSLLKDSDCLTMISEHQFQNELEKSEVKILPYSIDNAKRPIGITVRKEWKPTATQSAFLSILKNNGQLLTEES